MILDSGDRTVFESGATRDLGEGKGRPTLMPLQVISRLLGKQTGDFILQSIAAFTEKGETRYLYAALLKFVTVAFDGEAETMILETAIHFEEGSKKYPPAADGTPNWKLGIPINCYLDSAIRHYLKWRRGDEDEPHHRSFCWNIMCCIWEVDYHHD